MENRNMVENYLKRQSFTKYLRLTLAFPLCEIAHYGEKSISVFQELFGSIGGTFIMAGKLSAGLSFNGD